MRSIAALCRFSCTGTLAVLPLYLPGSHRARRIPTRSSRQTRLSTQAMQPCRPETGAGESPICRSRPPRPTDSRRPRSFGRSPDRVGESRREAVPELEAALHLKPGDQGLESNLALAYAKSGDPARAVGQFSAAYQASQQPGGSPVDAGFCQAYARALAAVGKLDEAVQMFQAAVDRGAATADILERDRIALCSVRKLDAGSASV